MNTERLENERPLAVFQTSVCDLPDHHNQSKMRTIAFAFVCNVWQKVWDVADLSPQDCSVMRSLSHLILPANHEGVLGHVAFKVQRSRDIGVKFTLAPRREPCCRFEVLSCQRGDNLIKDVWLTVLGTSPCLTICRLHPFPAETNSQWKVETYSSHWRLASLHLVHTRILRAHLIGDVLPLAGLILRDCGIHSISNRHMLVLSTNVKLAFHLSQFPSQSCASRFTSISFWDRLAFPCV